MANEVTPIGAVLTGGRDGTNAPLTPIVPGRPAAARDLGGAAVGRWPDWALPQLEAAITVARSAAPRASLAGHLYRDWFAAPVGQVDLSSVRPLAGLYRAAHAGSRRRIAGAELSVVARHDVVRAGGWWRTWGEHWTPPRSRAGSVRLLFTPFPDQLAEFVATVTGQLIDIPQAWSLACAIDERRISRAGCAVLDLPSPDAIPGTLLEAVRPLLRMVTPPLCLPLAPGVGAAQYPDNGMTFGEHRCHLVALAMRRPGSNRHPLRTLAAVFSAHGIDPAHPYREC